MNNFAPILITTLNRDKHFIRCVESLANCTHANKTDIYIGLDYPLNESHWEGYKNIDKYLGQIKGFKSINIFRRDKNFGAIKNSEDLFIKVFQKFDRLIETEDDNEFSPNFLDYINKGLEKFENDERVIAICGQRHLIDIPKDYNYNYYLAKGFLAWGYGIWKRKYKSNVYVYSVDELKELLKDKHFVNKLKMFNEKLYYSIQYYIRKNRILHGDGAIAIDMIIHDTYCVYPTKTKGRNYGFDGSGIHGGNIENNKYSNLDIDKDNLFEYMGKANYNNPKINKSLRNYRKVSNSKKIRFNIKNIIFSFGNKTNGY